MRNSGLHLGTKNVVFLLHPLHPTLHLTAELTGLLLRLLLDGLGPSVGLQLYAGGPLLQGGVSLGVRFQGGDPGLGLGQ